MKLIDTKTAFEVVDDSGQTVALFGRAYKREALAFVQLPRILRLLDSVVDGAEGYVCEVGDGHRYWKKGVIEEAGLLLDSLPQGLKQK